jgi:hypothetical protein
VPGLARRPLPELALGSVDGGRILEAFGPADGAKLLQQLHDQIEPDWRLAPRELQRVFHYACGRRAAPAERRRAWRRLRARAPVR